MKGQLVICLHQMRRPKEYIKVQGVGNCTICEPSEENKKCIKYCPVTLCFDDIEEKYNVL